MLYCGNFCAVCLLDPKVYLFIVMIWVVFVWLWLCSTNVYDKYPSPLWFMGLTLPSWSDILNMKWCLSMTDWRLVYFFLEIHCLQHKLNWSTGKLLNIGIDNLNPNVFDVWSLLCRGQNALDNTVITCIFWLLENTFISKEGVFDLSLIQ